MSDTDAPPAGAVETKPPEAAAPGGATGVKEKPKASRSSKPGQLPPYNVVLLNDEEHTYEYVIEMLRKLFGHPESKGFLLATQVDRTGRAIVLTTHKEKAELKRDQIHGFGRDFRMEVSKGPMSAIIEPAEG